MSEAAATIEVLRARDFRRMVALSAALHVVLPVAAAVTLPSWSDHEIPAGPMIEMVTAAELAARTGEVAPAPKPKAPPKPEPALEPTPPPPPIDRIVIPEDTHRKPAKPKKPAEPREPAPRESSAQEEEQVDLEDLLIEERILSGAMPGEAKPEARPQLTPGGGGTGPPVTPEVAAWQHKVRTHVRRTWGLTPGLRDKGLKTLARVELTASGVILHYEVERSSGNPWFDDSVERYLEEAGSLPAPPESGEWPIEFKGDF